MKSAWKNRSKKKHEASSLAYIVTYIGSEPQGGIFFDKMRFKRFEIAQFSLYNNRYTLFNLLKNKP